MRKKLFRFHIVLFTFISLWLQAQVIRVAPTPSGSGNGSSWANASSLQNAIAIASSNSQIWVEQGNYPVSSTLLVSLSNISIYGGFAGNETALNQRDWTNNTTVFNGQNTVKIMRFSSNNGIIDGIHFRNGFVTGTVDTTNDGGGALRLAGHDQIIRNCTFLNNISTSERGGGAIFIWSGGGQLIQNCSFENNTHIITTTDSNGGGAIHNWDEDVTIRNCRFINNSSSRSGGAIYSWGENFNIEGSRFVNNHSDDNGGAIHNNYYDISISNSRFEQNSSGENGGAIDNDDLLYVTNSLFNGNTAAVVGGAIYNDGELYTANSTFVSNQNTAIAYSRFASSGSFNHITNVFNSIFYNNTSVAPKLKDIDQGYSGSDLSTKDFRRNIFQENTFGSNNLVGVNPLFQNFAGGNFRLQLASPGVNYGNNSLYNQVSTIPAASSRDLANNPRVFGASIDLGAYELQQNQQVPICTQLTTPANNSTNISINPNLTWTAVSNATGYRLYVGTSATNFNFLNGQDVGNVTSYPLNGLQQGTQYFVRFVPYNTVGNAINCTVTNFTTIYGDEDGDGVLDDKDLCPGTPQGIPVDQDGCPVCSNPIVLNIAINTTDVIISIQGGIQPYYYQLDGGIWQTTNNSFIQFANLSSGEHQVIVRTEDTCETSARFSIIKVANVITPNGDGYNDEINLSALLLKQNAKFIIFDRNGSQKFEGNTSNNYIWNGKESTGRKLSTGTYWYILEWVEPTTDKHMKLTGWILLKNR